MAQPQHSSRRPAITALDIYVGAMEDRRKLGEGVAPPDILKKKVAAGELGRKSGKGFYEYPGVKS